MTSTEISTIKRRIKRRFFLREILLVGQNVVPSIDRTMARAATRFEIHSLCSISSDVLGSLLHFYVCAFVSVCAFVLVFERLH